MNTPHLRRIQQNGGSNLSTHDEKGCLKVRLTEEEKVKLEHDAALSSGGSLHSRRSSEKERGGSANIVSEKRKRTSDEKSLFGV